MIVMTMTSLQCVRWAGVCDDADDCLDATDEDLCTFPVSFYFATKERRPARVTFERGKISIRSLNVSDQQR